jgi:hypothetical protein
MDAQTIAELFKPMNASQIISTLETLQQSGANLTSVDLPAVISQLNVTQVEGLLASDSQIVNGLLQSLNPSQLFTVVRSFQTMTSTLFTAAAKSNSTEAAKVYYSTGTTLVTLLMEKIENVFTNAQLLGMFKLMTNGAAFGTGSKKLISMAKDLVAGFFAGNPPSSVAIPAKLEGLVSAYQPAIFGDYPDATDVAPSAVFLSIFAVITISHTSLFIRNYTLGHKFFVSLGLAFYSLMRTLSFILRLAWAKNLLNLDLGLTSTIFLVLCTIFLPTLNLILAQRYFTWKHPLYGSHKIFMTLMYIIYALVLGVIVMTIIAACVQTLYLLSEKHFNMTKQVIQASSILILFYSLIAGLLVFLAFVIPPTNEDKQLLTYQPYWIKSFSWNYFVPKGIAQKEEQVVSEDQKQAIRVINSTSYHYETIHDASAQGDHQLHHTSSIFVIAFTTILLLIADIFRTVSTFINQYHYEQSWIFNHVVMYVMFGVLEVIINVTYLVARIDLRFYKPDSLKNVILSKDKSNAEASQEEKAIESTASEDN